MLKIKLSRSEYIRVFSDIHLDFDISEKGFNFDKLWMPEILETDLQTVLILAGDLWHAKKPFDYCDKSWLKELSKKFQYVIIVLGNHDFWGGNFPKEYENYKNTIKQQNLNNVFLLQDSIIEIGSHKFLGGTLWTDFLKGNTEAMEFAETGYMKDYQHIKYGDINQRIRAKHLLSAHIQTKNFIFSHATKDYVEQKVWVITHHLPTIRSVPDKFFDSRNEKNHSALYYSDLSQEIKKAQIDYWIHGHTHLSQEYNIGKTTIISNPRGYLGEDTMYNPWHLMKLD